MFQVMQGASRCMQNQRCIKEHAASRCIKACVTSKVHKPDEQRFCAAAGFQEDFCAVKAKLSLDQCEEATWITINKGATLATAKVHQCACKIKGAEAKQDFAFMLLEDFCTVKAKLLLDRCEEAKWIATNKGARFLPTL